MSDLTIKWVNNKYMNIHESPEAPELKNKFVALDYQAEGYIDSDTLTIHLQD